MQVLSTVLQLGRKNACNIINYQQETIKIVTSKMIEKLLEDFY